MAVLLADPRPFTHVAYLIGPDHSGVSAVTDDLAGDCEFFEFVESARELRLLVLAARTSGVPLGVVELTAGDLELAGRAYRHRTCPTCGSRVSALPPGLDAGPTFSPEPDAGCAACGGSPVQWSTDQVKGFLDGLDSYRRRARALRAAAADLSVPWVCVPSVDDREDRSMAVRSVIERLASDALGSDTIRPAVRLVRSGGPPSPETLDQILSRLRQLNGEHR